MIGTACCQITMARRTSAWPLRHHPPRPAQPRPSERRHGPGSSLAGGRDDDPRPPRPLPVTLATAAAKSTPFRCRTKSMTSPPCSHPRQFHGCRRGWKLNRSRPPHTGRGTICSVPDRLNPTPRRPSSASMRTLHEGDHVVIEQHAMFLSSRARWSAAFPKSRRNACALPTDTGAITASVWCKCRKIGLMSTGRESVPRIPCRKTRRKP